MAKRKAKKPKAKLGKAYTNFAGNRFQRVAQFTASKRRYKTEAAAWKAVSKQHGLGTFDAAPAHTATQWRWFPVAGGLAGARARQENPLRMAVIGNPCEMRPLSELSGKKSKEFKAAVKRYKRFHGVAPTHYRRILRPDGSKQTTQQLLVELGKTPQTQYFVDAKSSSKNGPLWYHDHREGEEPILALDPETGTWMAIPTSERTKVTDWFRG